MPTTETDVHPVATVHRVVALALPSVILLDLAAPTHLFGHCGAGRYTFCVAGLRAGRVPTSTGLALVTEHGLGALQDADTIVVAGTADLTPTSGVRRAARALARAHARGARIVSICTGAFLLGEAGLLDGRAATTHWHSASELARRFPLAEVDPNVLYVDSGSVLTSAGVATGLDLCLHVVRRDHGAAFAADLARRVVIAPHREGGQAQFIPPARRAPSADTSTAPARAWALEHLAGEISVAELAARASMSSRTFARRFGAEMGMPPARWVREQRLRRAQALLETTHASIEEIARTSGFGDAATLRGHFHQALGTTPSAYRLRFAARA